MTGRNGTDLYQGIRSLIRPEKIEVADGRTDVPSGGLDMDLDLLQGVWRASRTERGGTAVPEDIFHRF
jgi:hypothetical protein